MRNSNFICPRCAQVDVTPSVIIKQGNYGSAHDTERVTVKVFGECFDKVFESVQRQIPAEAMNIEFCL